MTNLTTKRPQRTALGWLHSNDPADAALRADQAHVDADIEGMARDPDTARMIAQMDSDGVPIEQQVERLKAHYTARQNK